MMSFDPVLAEWETRFAPTGGTILDLAPERDPVRDFVRIARGLKRAGEGEPVDLLLSHPEPTGANYADFLGRFLAEIRAASGRLRIDRFAVVVAPDVDWTDDSPCGFPGHAAEVFAECGLRLCASLPYVIDDGTCGATVHVFVKGDRRAARTACGT